MARKESPQQQEIVGRVMHEFKHGELRSGKAGKAKNPRQAIAIALSEAGVSNQQSPQQTSAATSPRGREGQGQTGRARAASGTTRAELYERAKREGVPGRSKMNKAELEKALNARAALSWPGAAAQGRAFSQHRPAWGWKPGQGVQQFIADLPASADRVRVQTPCSSGGYKSMREAKSVADVPMMSGTGSEPCQQAGILMRVGPVGNRL